MDLPEQQIRSQFRSGEVDLILSPHSSGWAIGSPYVDLFWTPVVGAGAMAFARWAQHRLTKGEVTVFTSVEIGEALGRMHPGKACAVVTRAVLFHVAELVPSGGEFDVIQVRTALPTLGDDRVDQLSPALRRLHETYLEQLAGSR